MWNLCLFCSRQRRSRGPRWLSSSSMLPGSVSTSETSTPLWPSSVSLILWHLRVLSLTILPHDLVLIAEIRFLPRSRYEHESRVTPEEDLEQSQDRQVLHSRGKHNPTIHWLKYKTGNNLKLTAYRLLPFVLTASDGSYGKLLQLQDSPEGGRPSLSDCQQ